MTSASEPLMLAILGTKLQGSDKPFLTIAAFMHTKYTEYLLTCLNGNTQVMDLVDGWCEMGVKYSLEIENCKNDIRNSKLVQVLNENADIKHELEVLKKQIEARDDADYRKNCVEMDERVEIDEYQNMDDNHENHENSDILDILDSPILKKEADILEDLLTNPLLNNTDSMDLQINSENNWNSSPDNTLRNLVEMSEIVENGDQNMDKNSEIFENSVSSILKQETDFVDDKLTNPSSNITNLHISSENDRNDKQSDLETGQSYANSLAATHSESKAHHENEIGIADCPKHSSAVDAADSSQWKFHCPKPQCTYKFRAKYRGKFLAHLDFEVRGRVYMLVSCI